VSLHLRTTSRYFLSTSHFIKVAVADFYDESVLSQTSWYFSLHVDILLKFHCEECRPILGELLKKAAEDGVDVQDRALFYYQLLSADLEEVISYYLKHLPLDNYNY
jgi:hypothetical protein